MRTNKVLLIMQKDIEEIFRNKLVYFYIVIFLVFGLSYYNTFRSVVDNIALKNLSFEEYKFTIKSSIDFIFANIPLSVSMLSCTIFSTYSISMEKAKRSMESLLATPISAIQVWLGKSLAVAIPSIIFSVVDSFLVLILMNHVISTYFNAFLFPSALSLVTGLVIVSLLISLINLLVILVQLITSNQIVGRLIFVGIFILTYSPITLLGLNTLNSIALAYLLACAILTIVVILLKGLLTKERIVLSSK